MSTWPLAAGPQRWLPPSHPGQAVIDGLKCSLITLTPDRPPILSFRCLDIGSKWISLISSYQKCFLWSFIGPQQLTYIIYTHVPRSPWCLRMAPEFVQASWPIGDLLAHGLGLPAPIPPIFILVHNIAMWLDFELVKVTLHKVTQNKVSFTSSCLTQSYFT